MPSDTSSTGGRRELTFPLTQARQLSEARATNEELFEGMVVPELVGTDERETPGPVV